MATPSLQAVEELQSAWSRVINPLRIERFWDRVLSPDDRERLGGDLRAAYRKYDGPVGIWMHLRGVSDFRALIEVARALNFLSELEAQWLLREFGELAANPEQTIAAAIETGALVLTERPRAIYWEGQEIAVNWNELSAPWHFLCELCRKAKSGLPIDSTDFENKDAKYIGRMKSRLGAVAGFPLSLADLIESAGRATYRLNVPRERIRIFETETIEILREQIG